MLVVDVRCLVNDVGKTNFAHWLWHMVAHGPVSSAGAGLGVPLDWDRGTQTPVAPFSRNPAALLHMPPPSLRPSLCPENNPCEERVAPQGGDVPAVPI